MCFLIFFLPFYYETYCDNYKENYLKVLTDALFCSIESVFNMLPCFSMFLGALYCKDFAVDEHKYKSLNKYICC